MNKKSSEVLEEGEGFDDDESGEVEYSSRPPRRGKRTRLPREQDEIEDELTQM